MKDGHSPIYRRLLMLFSFLASAMRAGVFSILGRDAPANPVLNAGWCSNVDFLLVLVLLTCLVCDTACIAAMEIVTDRIIAPFRQHARHRRPPSSAGSTGLSRSLRQWLCSPSRNEKNRRPCHAIRVSHNRAPPHLPLPQST